MIIRINRTIYEDKQTLGEGFILEGNLLKFKFKTLELPWLDNEPYISCIPLGKYLGVKRTSARFGDHLHILDVPERSLILVHYGNYFRDTEGCALVGKTLVDIDGDGYRDVTHSRLTMEKINKLLPERFEVQITNYLNLTT